MTGEPFELRGIAESSEVSVLSEEPLNEPIAATGPFVMNSYEEIPQATPISKTSFSAAPISNPATGITPLERFGGFRVQAMIQ